MKLLKTGSCKCGDLSAISTLRVSLSGLGLAVSAARFRVRGFSFGGLLARLWLAASALSFRLRGFSFE